MNKQFIINYIKQVKKEDIAFFALNQGLNVSNKELDLIYYYIKNEYERFLIILKKYLKKFMIN